MGAAQGKEKSKVLPLPSPSPSLSLSLSRSRSLSSKIVVLSAEDKLRYINEGIIDPYWQDDSHELLFYMFLDHEISVRVLKHFSEKQEGLSILMDCWFDIMKYRKYKPSTAKKQHERGQKIYLKYIVKENLDVNKTSDKVTEKLMTKTEISEKTKSVICMSNNNKIDGDGISSYLYMQELNTCKVHFQGDVQHKQCNINCTMFPDGFNFLLKQKFHEMYNLIYLPLLAINLNNEMKLYEAVTSPTGIKYGSVNDFVFEKSLGMGAFGIVVLCKKISTGKKYAMKLQELDKILEYHRDNADEINVCCESEYLSRSSHPYIINMFSAFQTKKLAVMVLEYVPEGDLSTLLKSTNNKKLPLKQVIFHTAELVSAIGYMVSTYYLLLLLLFVYIICIFLNYCTRYSIVMGLYIEISNLEIFYYILMVILY